MTGSFSRRLTGFLLLALALSLGTAQVNAGSEGARPIATVEVFSPLGLTTFRASKLFQYSFLASWEVQAGGPLGSTDLYFGLLSPDRANAYTWTRQGESFELVQGMQPMMEGVSLNTPAIYSSSELAGGDLRLTIPGNVPSGMYFVFALMACGGTNPADPANWVQVEMKPLFVQ